MSCLVFFFPAGHAVANPLLSFPRPIEIGATPAVNNRAKPFTAPTGNVAPKADVGISVTPVTSPMSGTPSKTADKAARFTLTPGYTVSFNDNTFTLDELNNLQPERLAAAHDLTVSIGLLHGGGAQPGPFSQQRADVRAAALCVVWLISFRLHPNSP